MSAAKSPVSIIICAYTIDRWQDICEAIDSARRQEPPPEEIILVSDYNRELEDRARMAFQDVVVVSNKEEQGLSGARNSGIAVSHGQVVAFLDDDAIADEHWTSHLLSECEKPGNRGSNGEGGTHLDWETPAMVPRRILMGGRLLLPRLAETAAGGSKSLRGSLRLAPRSFKACRRVQQPAGAAREARCRSPAKRPSFASERAKSWATPDLSFSPML